jgi:predicted ATPase
MISSLRLTDFKSFGGPHEIPLGPFTVIVGTNASGKSNLRDALRFVHAMARGYTLAEILGGKYGDGGESLWHGIRGGVREIFHGTGSGRFGVGMDARFLVPPDYDKFAGRWPIRHDLEVVVQGGIAEVSTESLTLDSVPVFRGTASNIGGKSIDFELWPNPDSPQGRTTLRRNQPAVSQLAPYRKEATDGEARTGLVCQASLQHLSRMRFFDFSPESLRRPSLPGQTSLSERGENLASVLQAICEDPKRKAALIEWIRELTPLDVVGLSFPTVNLEGKIQLVLIETGGHQISADSASDGTLRFLAFAAAVLGPHPSAIYVFEEIDNGIHPNRAHLLLELLQKATAGGDIQIIATTHSPALLNALRGPTLDDALLVTRKGSRSRVYRLGNLPIPEEDRTAAGDLLEAGWFETVTTFLEADEAEAKADVEAAGTPA